MPNRGRLNLDPELVKKASKNQSVFKRKNIDKQQGDEDIFRVERNEISIKSSLTDKDLKKIIELIYSSKRININKRNVNIKMYCPKDKTIGECRKKLYDFNLLLLIAKNEVIDMIRNNTNSQIPCRQQRFLLSVSEIIRMKQAASILGKDWRHILRDVIVADMS